MGGRVPVNRPRPRPHKCSNSGRNPADEKAEMKEASDLKVKVSEGRKVKKDVWEEGGRVCSLQEVAVKAPSGVVTVEHFGDAVTPVVDFVEPGVRLYRRNVSKYTYTSHLPMSKPSVGGAKSNSSTLLDPPPLICDCTVNSQPNLTNTLKSLPKVIVKDSVNFAKYRHDVSDTDQRMYSNVSAGTPVGNRSELMGRPSKTKTYTVASNRSRIPDHELKKIKSSHSLFSFGGPSKNGHSKSRLSRIAENTSPRTSSKASSNRPVVRVVSGHSVESNKMDGPHVLKRITYRAEGVLQGGKSTSPRKSVRKPKIHPTRNVLSP